MSTHESSFSDWNYIIYILNAQKSNMGNCHPSWENQCQPRQSWGWHWFSRGDSFLCYTPSFFLLYKSNTINTQYLTVNNKIHSSCKTVLLTSQQFIDLLPAIQLLTDGLIFICLISHVKLTSQCRCVVQILGLDGQGY